jgi:hypothetical protein
MTYQTILVHMKLEHSNTGLLEVVYIQRPRTDC